MVSNDGQKSLGPLRVIWHYLPPSNAMDGLFPVSSGVERILGKDEAVSSNLTPGTIALLAINKSERKKAR